MLTEKAAMKMLHKGCPIVAVSLGVAVMARSKEGRLLVARGGADLSKKQGCAPEKASSEPACIHYTFATGA